MTLPTMRGVALISQTWWPFARCSLVRPTVSGQSRFLMSRSKTSLASSRSSDLGVAADDLHGAILDRSELPHVLADEQERRLVPAELDDLARLDDVLAPGGLGHVEHARAAQQGVVDVEEGDDGSVAALALTRGRASNQSRQPPARANAGPAA